MTHTLGGMLVVAMVTLAMILISIGAESTVVVGTDAQVLDPELADSMRRLVTFIPGQTLEHHGENWETQSAVRLGEFRVVMDGKWCSTSEHFLVLASYELNESRLIEAGILREVVQADSEGAVGSTGYSSRVLAAFPREEPVSAFVFDKGLGSTHWGYFVVGWINDPDVLEFEIEITDGRRLRLNADEHEFFTAVLTIGPVEKTRAAALQFGIRAVSVTAQR